MIVDLERNDLSRVCEPGTRPLARADDRAASSPASRTSSRRVEGRLRDGVDAAGDPRGDVPGRLDHGRAENLGDRPHRGARAGRPRRLDGRARDDQAERRLRSRADDPYLRGRRRPHPPLGRRRDRLGLRAGGGDRGVLGEGAPAAGRSSAAVCRAARRCPHDAARRSRSGGRGRRRRPTSPSSTPTTRRSSAAAPPSRRRASTAGGPFKLDDHLARLAGSAARIGLPPVDPVDCAALARDALAASGAARRRPAPLLDAGPRGRRPAERARARSSTLPTDLEELRAPRHQARRAPARASRPTCAPSRPGCSAASSRRATR